MQALCIFWTGETEFDAGVGETKEEAFRNLVSHRETKYPKAPASDILQQALKGCDYILIPEKTKAFSYE